jgi:hypothetical protein
MAFAHAGLSAEHNVLMIPRTLLMQITLWIMHATVALSGSLLDAATCHQSPTCVLSVFRVYRQRL